MSPILDFGTQPPAEHNRLSLSSSPQPSMSSSSESPSGTPIFDTYVFSPDRHSEERRSGRGSVGEILPKIEETELRLEDVKTEPGSDDTPLSTSEPPQTRRRGRPRIHPPRSPTTASKQQAKARCKTGCTTCRKRKKKCDETKPYCLSCQKNNIHCEGYKPVTIWQPGKEREKDKSGRRLSRDVKFELPSLIPGIDTDTDRKLYQHFIDHASAVFGLSGNDQENPFTHILLPMALQHQGLMHSVLCLSASHLNSIQPLEEYKQRGKHHQSNAFTMLRQDISKIGGQTTVYADYNVAQIILHLLHSVCDGNTSGEYKLHMQAAQQIAARQQSDNPAFQKLFYEFFYYHWIASGITSLDGIPVPMMENFALPFQINPETADLIGVSDGLFGFISKISNLRRRLRVRIDNKNEPIMDYEALVAANAIDVGLRDWQCPVAYGTHRHTISMLYRQATWVYLYRTIRKSVPSDDISKAVDGAIGYINELPAEPWIQSNMLLPLFLIGCAAFKKEQRVEVDRAFNGLTAATGLGNITCAKEIIDHIWRLMDAEDPESWDWEKLIHAKGWDFLVT